MLRPIYKRVILKISGEGLGREGFGVNQEVFTFLAQEIKKIIDLKVQVAVILGGGNYLRGSKKDHLSKVKRTSADYIGMLGTIMNAIVFRDVLASFAVQSEIFSALPVGCVIKGYNIEDANCALNAGKVVFIPGGTGNPLVTTDSALSLRGIELNCDLLLKATNVDGVYSTDPQKDPQAKLFSTLTYQEAISHNLKVMDLGSFLQCQEFNKKLVVFNLRKENALVNIVCGQKEGTTVLNEESL